MRKFILILSVIVLVSSLTSCITTAKSGCWKGAEPKVRPFEKMRG